jgi:phage gp29-like protein
MRLLDQFGRPIEINQLKKEIAAPTLTGVRTIWSDTVAAGLTPDRLARILRDAAQGNHDSYLTLAAEMEERNLHYAAELGKRKLAVSLLPMTVEAYSDDKKDKDLADEVRNIIRRPGTRSLIKNLLDGIAKGYSVVEIIWDRTGPHWMPSFKWRDPHFFIFDRISRSEIRLRDNSNMMEGIPLAPYKFITHTPVIKSGIPVRNGLAFLAAWAFMCAGYTIKDWLAFAEVFGMPLRMGKYAPGASEGDISILKTAVANLGSDAAAVFPESMKIELVEAAKASGTDFFRQLAEHLNDLISEAVIGQTASSGGTPGRLGEEKLQSNVRDDIRDDDALQIEETLNMYLVRPFIDLNYGPQENYPAIWLRAPKQEDIKTLSEALGKLVPLGLRVSQSVVRDKIGIPDPAEDEELLTAPAKEATPEPQAPAIKATNRESRAQNQEGADQADAVDDIVDEQLAEWEPVVDSLVSPVGDLIDELVQQGGTLQDLLARLPEIYPDANDDRLITELAQAMFKARAMGTSTDEVSDAR